MFRCLGAEKVKPLNDTKTGLIFKMTKYILNKTKNFASNVFHFTMSTQSKKATDVVNVAKHADISKMKRPKTKTNVNSVYSGNNNSVMAITFKTENAHKQIPRNAAKPALLANAWCT